MTKRIYPKKKSSQQLKWEQNRNVIFCPKIKIIQWKHFLFIISNNYMQTDFLKSKIVVKEKQRNHIYLTKIEYDRLELHTNNFI